MNDRVAASARWSSASTPSCSTESQIPIVWRSSAGGAQFVIQRAMEDEVAAFLARTRHAREPNARGSQDRQGPRGQSSDPGHGAASRPC